MSVKTMQSCPSASEVTLDDMGNICLIILHQKLLYRDLGTLYWTLSNNMYHIKKWQILDIS